MHASESINNVLASTSRQPRIHRRTANQLARLQAATLIASALACTLATSASAQTIINTGVPNGVSSITLFTISGDGQVGVGYGTNARSYRWTQSGGFEDLGLSPGTYATQASGLSADGSVIAGQSFLLAGRFHATRWTSAGGFQNLGFLPGGNFSYGYAISANGAVVVGQANNSTQNYQAYRWAAGVMTALPALPLSFGSAQARGVNATGSIVTGYDFVGGAVPGYRGFRWTSSTGTQPLSPLPGHTGSRALCISADGQVIAGVSNVSGTNNSVPVIWSPSGTITNLGLAPNMNEAEPSSISADGSVIGLLTRINGNPRAGMWSTTTGTVDLNAYLPTIGVNMTGWVLTRTYGVSGDGRTITGEGAQIDSQGIYHPGCFVVSLGCLLPPTIANQPDPRAACVTDSVFFEVTPAGVGPFSYAWRANGTAIDPQANPTAATSTLSLTDIQFSNSASYDCIVSNPCGGITSNPATLTVEDCYPCPADFNRDGGIDGNDIDAFISAWENGNLSADANQDGGIDGSDVESFFFVWGNGGC